MPTYEYRCESCGDFEAVHGMKDPSLAACPTCGKPVTRLISKGGGLIFKGSGFYITDYRSADYKEKAEKESGTKPAAAETKPAGGAESKPAVTEARSGGGTTAAPAAPASSPSAAPSSGTSSSSSSTSSSGGPAAT